MLRIRPPSHSPQSLVAARDTGPVAYHVPLAVQAPVTLKYYDFPVYRVSSSLQAISGTVLWPWGSYLFLSFLADSCLSLFQEMLSDPQTRAAVPRGSHSPLSSIPPCSYLVTYLSDSGIQVALAALRLARGSLGPASWVTCARARPQEAAWRELEAERSQLQSQLQREQEELLARLEAEKEELSEEIAALQQERDEGLLLAESEKQQVRVAPTAAWPAPVLGLVPAQPPSS